MCGHGLRIFESPAGFEIGSDSGRAEDMAADLDLGAKFRCTALDHAPGVDPVHGFDR